MLKTVVVLNIYADTNNNRAANQHIRIISDRSCDPEDWSNEAENSTLHHSNK